MKKFFTIRACVVLFSSIGITAGCFSQDHPTEDAFSIGQFSIGQSTLAEIAGSLGQTNERLEEDGLVKKACYVVTDALKNARTIEFESSVIGGLSRITGFTIRSQSSDAKCTPSRLPLEQLQPKNGVVLGMSESDFRRVAPLAFKPSNGRLTYLGESTRVASEREAKSVLSASPTTPLPVRFDVTVEVQATFLNGILSEYYVSRLETL